MPARSTTFLALAAAVLVAAAPAAHAQGALSTQGFGYPPGGLFGSEPTTRVPFVFTLYPSDRRPFVMWERPEQ